MGIHTQGPGLGRPITGAQGSSFRLSRSPCTYTTTMKNRLPRSLRHESQHKGHTCLRPATSTYDPVATSASTCSSASSSIGNVGRRSGSAPRQARIAAAYPPGTVPGTAGKPGWTSSAYEGLLRCSMLCAEPEWSRECVPAAPAPAAGAAAALPRCRGVWLLHACARSGGCACLYWHEGRRRRRGATADGSQRRKQACRSSQHDLFWLSEDTSAGNRMGAGQAG